MSSENVVHIKLEYDEAINAKRNILSSEISSLRAAKAATRYHALRMAELNLKGKIYTKLKETRANIKKVQALLPEPRVPRILKRVHKEESHMMAKPMPQVEDIESQLGEIQRRLDSLQR